MHILVSVRHDHQNTTTSCCSADSDFCAEFDHVMQSGWAKLSTMTNPQHKTLVAEYTADSLDHLAVRHSVPGSSASGGGQ